MAKRYFPYLVAGVALLFPWGASAQSTNPQAPGSLLIRTDETALVSVDGKSIGMAQAYQPIESPLTPGNHLVSAVALAGTERADQAVQVGAGQRAIVLLDLGKARQQQEQQAQEHQQQEKQVQQKQQCMIQLQAKRAEYQLVDQKYTNEVQLAQQSAQAAALGSMNSSGPQWMQALNGGLSGLNKLAAQDHQNKAQQLLIQLDQLRQEVSDLQRCPVVQ